MLPSQLKTKYFDSYPREARQIATTRIELLRQLPLSFLPLLLRELIAYDWKFPAERRELDHQLAYLGSLSRDRPGSRWRGLRNCGFRPISSMWIG